MTAYAIIWTGESTRLGHLAAVFAVSGPYTLSQCHDVLDAAADTQDTGYGRECRARIVRVGDPFGIGDLWDPSGPSGPELLAEDDERAAKGLVSHLAHRRRAGGDDAA